MHYKRGGGLKSNSESIVSLLRSQLFYTKKTHTREFLFLKSVFHRKYLHSLIFFTDEMNFYLFIFSPKKFAF